jgi:hypothetical protein
MTERECRTGIQEAADFYRRAVRLASGPQALTTEPPDPPLAASLLSAVWTQVIPSGFGVRLRSGPHFIVPFVRADAPVLAVALTTGERSGHLAVRTVIDRRTLAEGHLVIEVPLRGSRGDFRLAPARSPDAIAGRWMAGEPGFVVAPDSLRVIGSSFSLHVTSATVFAWTLVRDEHDANVTWLQGLVSVQAPGCILEPRRRTPLTFEVLHPGEPARLVVHLDISVESVLKPELRR